MQRLITADELRDARGMIGWRSWAPPIIFSLMCVAAVWFGVRGLFAVALILFAAWGWIMQLRAYSRITTDIEGQMVEVLEGGPDSVWKSRYGICYMTIAGHRLQIPVDCYGELREANFVKVAFLPESRIAVRVDMSRGVGLQR